MQKSKIVIPLHYNKEEKNLYQIIKNRATFVTETDKKGNVKVVKSEQVVEINEMIEITATTINQSSDPKSIAENLITYLQDKYKIA